MIALESSASPRHTRKQQFQTPFSDLKFNLQFFRKSKNFNPTVASVGQREAAPSHGAVVAVVLSDQVQGHLQTPPRAQGSRLQDWSPGPAGLVLAPRSTTAAAEALSQAEWVPTSHTAHTPHTCSHRTNKGAERGTQTPRSVETTHYSYSSIHLRSSRKSFLTF